MYDRESQFPPISCQSSPSLPLTPLINKSIQIYPQKHFWQNQGWREAALRSRAVKSVYTVCLCMRVCLWHLEALTKATAAVQRGGPFTPLLRSNMAALSGPQEEPRRGRRGQRSGSAGTTDCIQNRWSLTPPHPQSGPQIWQAVTAPTGWFNYCCSSQPNSTLSCWEMYVFIHFHTFMKFDEHKMHLEICFQRFIVFIIRWNLFFDALAVCCCVMLTQQRTGCMF